MWTKLGSKLQKNFEMRTSGGGGGGGGSSVISDTPGRGGEGGSKKCKFLRTSFMDGPLDSQMYNKLGIISEIFDQMQKQARYNLFEFRSGVQARYPYNFRKV